MSIDELIIISGIIIISLIAIKYICKYHDILDELRPDIVLAEETPIVIAIIR